MTRLESQLRRAGACVSKVNLTTIHYLKKKNDFRELVYRALGDSPHYLAHLYYILGFNGNDLLSDFLGELMRDKLYNRFKD